MSDVIDSKIRADFSRARFKSFINQVFSVLRGQRNTLLSYDDVKEKLRIGGPIYRGSLAPTQVRALILGEHGDSMVPIWSSAAVNGLPLTGLPQCSAGFQNAVFERTKGSGAEVIKKKGGAGWAVGIAIRDVIHAVLLNKRALLPVSSLVQGAYDIRNVCLSVPSVVGRRGVEKHVEIKLWPKELMGLQASARALLDTLGKVKA